MGGSSLYFGSDPRDATVRIARVRTKRCSSNRAEAPFCRRWLSLIGAMSDSNDFRYDDQKLIQTKLSEG